MYEKHPDTKIVFGEYCIPEVALAIEKAYILHGTIPQVGVINFNYTINACNESVPIEENTNFVSIWLPQMAYGVGWFGSNTADVLIW